MVTRFLQKKLLKLLVGISVVVLILVGAFFYFKKPPVVIPTVSVFNGSIIEQAEAVGYIKTRHFSTVKSQVNGIVESVYHDEGDYVAKNTPLAKIKPMPAPEVYASAHQELNNAISKEKEAEMAFERQKYLLDNKIIMHNNLNYTAARNTHALEKNNRILAEQKLSLLENGETIVAGKQIESVVVSPIDGNVLYRGVDIGDPVISISAAQAATTLFTMANMQELMFQGSVDERDAAKIKVGMMAKIKVGSLPDQEITGKIDNIALQSDKEKFSVSNNNNNNNKDQNSPFNVGFKVEIVDLKFPKYVILRSGFSATASIETKKADNVLMLPLRVIQYKDTKPHVLLQIKKNKKPKKQHVELGISDNINVEIKSGLKLGDKVLDKPDETVTTQD